MSSTCRWAVPLMTTKGIRLQKKWHPDRGVKTSWKSAEGTDAGKAIGSAGAQMLIKKAIGETVGVVSCLCVGVALSVCSSDSPQSLFRLNTSRPRK
ncbi:hypothetical protein TNCV_4593501 [Trichonephila clavipes]|uniref:Uncharacterized protein n=1 Tax=Trichonephila clavipes TaxID=2585209 RepID=A0A8X6WEN3_TRICX|nr:hypothetical protein TNCV_4593501 [Trichonephila clavipes]